MAVCFPRHLRTFSCSNTGYVTALLLITVLVSGGTATLSDQPVLYYYRPTSTIHSSSNGVYRFQTTDNSSLQLFGQNLNQSTIVKLTLSDTECDEEDSLFGSGDIVSVNYTTGPDNMVRASFYVTFPLVSSGRLFYFCLKNEDHYYHQGTADWLKLEVFTPSSDWLPLPVRIIFILVLMFLSGMFSGLNLGLMALDPTTLKIIEKSGSKKQKGYAKTIYRVRRHGNYLLCTLLLGNVLVNSTFTILLDDLVSGIYAIIGSTLAIVIFGEIIPQAICSRYGLLIGAHSIWLTYVFMVVTFPLSFPISLILDLILGKEIGAVYKRDQLLELLHVTQKDADLEDYELNIISGALQYKEKTVKDVMTKFQDVFCVSIDAVLDFKTIKMIYDSGFSRIPIYEETKGNIVGILYLRDLTFIDPDDCTPVRQVRDFYNRDPKWVFDDLSLEDMLKEFTQGQYHIAIVRGVEEKEGCDPIYVTLGVVTLEDIIEEILGREINDETDQFVDNVSMKPRPRKNMDIGDIMYTTPVIKLSAHQLLAVKQFLSSAVPPFQSPHISKYILDRLLQQDVVYELSQDESQSTGFALYRSGVPASYFTLLLEGCLKVHIGKESLTFEARGFYFFGSQVLIDVIESNTSGEYVPDFTVRPLTNCLVLLITKQRYMAAYRASQFELEKGQADRQGSDRDEVFIKEWKAAESDDLQSSLQGTSTGLSNIRHLLKTKPLQDFNNVRDQLGSTRSIANGRSRSPLQLLTNSPGCGRGYNMADITEDNDDDDDEDVCGADDERKSLLLGMDNSGGGGGSSFSNTVNNSTVPTGSDGDSVSLSPVVEVVVSGGVHHGGSLRTTRSLSEMESNV